MSDFNLIIKKAEQKDLPFLAKIEKEYTDYPHWGLKGLEAEIKKDFSTILIIEYQNEIAGFINFWIIKPIIEINSIVISKKYIRKGFATILIKKTIEYGLQNNCKEINLEVSENNIAAISLYKKIGFCETGRRYKYYNNMYDAILMRKEI